MNPVAPAPETPHSREEGALSTLFELAVDSAIRAWLVLLLGSIALEIVSSVAHNMLPSAPPGFSTTTAAESTSVTMTLWDGARLAVTRHRFVLLFSALFAISAWTRLGPTHAAQPTDGRKLLKRISDEWFGILVANAFGALIGAYILVWAEFSVEKWLLRGVLDWCLERSHELVQTVCGRRAGDAFADWQHWFSSNQFRFTFWCLYVAGICDDLGLPNLKTLGRKVWRRFRQKSEPEATPV